MPRSVEIGAFFVSKKGFRTFGAAYYDADDLTNPKQWLMSLKETPRAQGIMHTTWEGKYQLLAGFGEMLREDAQYQKGKTK